MIQRGRFALVNRIRTFLNSGLWDAYTLKDFIENEYKVPPNGVICVREIYVRKAGLEGDRVHFVLTDKDLGYSIYGFKKEKRLTIPVTPGDKIAITAVHLHQREMIPQEFNPEHDDPILNIGELVNLTLLEAWAKINGDRIPDY